LDAFDWHEPVGTMQHIQAFLTYRNEKMKALFDAAPDTDEVGTYAAPSP
jgi:hypothetical protein